MEFLVNRGIVKHNGAYHRAGSVFNATDEEVQHLVRSGAITRATYEFPQEQPEKPDSGEQEVEAPTPAEFAELKADAQKEILTGIEIDPGSNAEQRLQQYTEWYEQDDENPDDDLGAEDPEDEDDLDIDSDDNNEQL